MAQPVDEGFSSSDRTTERATRSSRADARLPDRTERSTSSRRASPGSLGARGRTVIGGASRDQGVIHVGQLLAEFRTATRNESVRLQEMRDPAPLPRRRRSRFAGVEPVASRRATHDGHRVPSSNAADDPGDAPAEHRNVPNPLDAAHLPTNGVGTTRPGSRVPLTSISTSSPITTSGLTNASAMP